MPSYGHSASMRTSTTASLLEEMLDHSNGADFVVPNLALGSMGTLNDRYDVN